MTLAAFGATILRCFIGMLLLAAVNGKLRNFADFRHNLADSLGLGTLRAKLLAPTVIGAELLVAVMVLGPAQRAGMLAALLMLAVFTAVVGYRFYSQGSVRCSCFGEAGRSVTTYDLQRNLLVMLSIVAYFALGADVAAPPFPQLALACSLAAILCVAAIGFHDIVVLLKHY